MKASVWAGSAAVYLRINLFRRKADVKKTVYPVSESLRKVSSNAEGIESFPERRYLINTKNSRTYQLGETTQNINCQRISSLDIDKFVFSC